MHLSGKANYFVRFCLKIVGNCFAISWPYMKRKNLYYVLNCQMDKSTFKNVSNVFEYIFVLFCNVF